MINSLTNHVVETIPDKLPDSFENIEGFETIRKELLLDARNLGNLSEVYLSKERKKLGLYVDIYSNTSEAAKNRTTLIPMYTTAVFAYTTDGWLDKEQLIKKLYKEVKLNDSLLKGLTNSANVKINKLVQLLTKATNLEDVEDVKAHIQQSLHKEHHPTELMNSNILYPENKHLRGVVYVKPKLDKTLNRSDLTYIAQKTKFITNRIKCETVVNLTKLRDTENGPLKSMEFQVSDTPEINKLTNHLINSIQDYISKELMVDVDLKVINNTFVDFCDKVDALNDESLNDLTVNVRDYLKNLIWCKYKLQINRVRDTKVLIEHLVDLIRKINEINI